LASRLSCWMLPARHRRCYVGKARLVEGSASVDKPPCSGYRGDAAVRCKLGSLTQSHDSSPSPAVPFSVTPDLPPMERYAHHHFLRVRWRGFDGVSLTPPPIPYRPLDIDRTEITLRAIPWKPYLHKSWIVGGYWTSPDCVITILITLECNSITTDVPRASGRSRLSVLEEGFAAEATTGTGVARFRSLITTVLPNAHVGKTQTGITGPDYQNKAQQAVCSCVLKVHSTLGTHSINHFKLCQCDPNIAGDANQEQPMELPS
jgi:hypothetical protein